MAKDMATERDIIRAEEKANLIAQFNYLNPATHGLDDEIAESISKADHADQQHQPSGYTAPAGFDNGGQIRGQLFQFQDDEGM